MPRGWRACLILSLNVTSLRFLAALPPDIKVEDSSASAIITDPKTGQILAAVGETLQAQETPLIAAHRPGSALDALIYLTGFTQRLKPCLIDMGYPRQDGRPKL